MKYKKAKRMLALGLSMTILGQLHGLVYADVYEYKNGRLAKIIYDDDSFVEFTYDNNGNTLSRNFHSSKTGEVEVNDPFLQKIKIADGISNELYLKYPDNVQKYVIYKKSSNQGTYEQIGETSKKSFKDDNIPNGACYIYQVKPVFTGETAPGGEASMEVQAKLGEAITNLSYSIESYMGNDIVIGVNDQLTNISLTWDAQQSGTVYEVKENCRNKTKVYGVDGNSFSNPNLTEPNYTYQVRSCVKEDKVSVYSPYTSEISFQVQVPEDIEDIWSSSNETGMKSVVWKIHDNSSNFIIYQAKNEMGPYHFYSAKMNSDVHSCICQEGFYYRVAAYQVMNGKLIFSTLSSAVQI